MPAMMRSGGAKSTARPQNLVVHSDGDHSILCFRSLLRDRGVQELLRGKAGWLWNDGRILALGIRRIFGFACEMRKAFPFTLLALLFLLATLVRSRANEALNVVFILVDDMGATDLGCTGSNLYETPNIDRLARQGMRFTTAYSACTVCSPTRAALLTGKDPARLHITDWIPGHVRPHAKLSPPDWLMHLPTDEPNLARIFSAAGYATASIGKWHLGDADSYPDKLGFGVNIGGYEKGQPPSYFAPYRIPTLTEGPAGEFLSDRLTDEALKFIEANKAKPFFLYLPHYAVHTPLQAKQDVVEKYRAKIRPDSVQKNPTYAALVESVDDSVGRILKKLSETGLESRTIVVFTSDNGGLLPVTVNLGLRAGKGSAYEGGVRVPLIVKWPGVTKPDSLCSVPVTTVDFFPTLLEAAGLKDAPNHVVDGESIVPLLRDASAVLKRRTIFWHYPHYHPGGATPYSAVRDGNWKLVEFYEDQHTELYDLSRDPGETTDLVAKEPRRATEMRAKLDAWRKEVGAQPPVPNPNFDAEKDAAKAAPKKPKS